MEPQPLLSLMLLAITCSEVACKTTLYGEGISITNDEKEFYDQFCPSSNKRKYVRIKTFNNKYVWAYPTRSGESSYLRTRCCGGKDAVGRKDVTKPSRHSTFLIHCATSRGQKVVRFEILNSRNKGSGFYFYAEPKYDSGLFANKYSRKFEHKFNFVIKRWRGPVVAIRTQGTTGSYSSHKELSNWLTFSERDHGYISGCDKPFKKYTNFPSLRDTFTLESVPSECVDVAWDREVFLAKPKKTSAEECERRADRCYWADDWDSDRRDLEKGACYYRADSPCSHGGRDEFSIAQYSFSAKRCDEEGLCFDYKRNMCYKIMS